ncbi:MAG: nucleoside hydrolase [Opitutaceae bacterium]|jgi:inosine-uridine nucleoside N-ribohydrolase|nr:nucleoside hydrolase [Opitutaceae bacterium]
MKTICLLCATIILGFCPPAFGADTGTNTKPVKLIFDTDMGNDVDDALALAVMHAMQSRGACELLAVTLTCPLPEAAPYVAALNAFYGRPAIPIGVNPAAPLAAKRSRYLPVASMRGPDGALLFPSKFDPAAAPRAVDLLRRVLAAAGDGEIVIVQTGFSTNLARLLETPGDAVSPLTGLELVRRKVRLLSIMAGDFAPVKPGKKPHVEYNVKWDIPAARKIVAGWPTPVWWSGFEVGLAVTYPAWSIDRDFDYIPRHPVRESYQAYKPAPHERPCWDVTSVAAVVWPERGYFDQARGRVLIDENGVSTFAPDDNGRDVVLKVNKEQSSRLRELFAALVSEPPHGGNDK